MRLLFGICAVLFCTMLSAQGGKKDGSALAISSPVVVKIKHEALEMRGEEAWYKGKLFTGLSFTFWENKRMNEQFSWKDGKMDGEYKEFTEEGELVTMITYTAGEKHGPYIYNYFTGATQSTGNFNHGLLNGLVTGYYSSGIKKYEVNYIDGVRNGISRTWFKNGAPEQIANYVNDLPDGEVYEYYQDSIEWSESEYKMGIRHGRYYQFHKKSGCPAVESYFKNGKLDSIRRIWNEINCDLIEEEHYLNGLKDGEFVLYDFVGDTLSVSHYKKNVLHGEYRLYQSKTKAETDQGVVLKYDNHRGLEVIGNYNEGLKDGFWRYGLTSNYQHREGNYKNGVMVGHWKFFDLKGRILMVQDLDDEGNIIKEKRYRRPRKNK